MNTVLLIVSVGVEYPALPSTVDCVGVVGFIWWLKPPVFSLNLYKGYIAGLKRGFREASTDIIVTFDADGEHRPNDIKKLVQPIAADKLDLVLGARSTIPRPSERLLNKLTQLRLDVHDSGTGLRALRRSLAVDLELDTVCTCGTFVLEAAARGARIGDVPVETRSVQKPRGIAWKHGAQFFHVLRHLLFSQTT